MVGRRVAQVVRDESRLLAARGEYSEVEGETRQVGSRYPHPMTPEDERLIAQHKEAIAKAVQEAGGNFREAIDTALEPRGWLYGNNEYGTRFFIDISGVYLKS